jgi:hypothetical protein
MKKLLKKYKDYVSVDLIMYAVMILVIIISVAVISIWF